MTIRHPTEEQEHMALAGWLTAIGVTFIHVPNESKRPVREKVNRRGEIIRYCPQAQRLKRMGLSPGFPDVLIFSLPKYGWKREAFKKLVNEDLYYPNGVAVELKRINGPKPTKEQVAWLSKLIDCGWVTNICEGADEAIAWLKSLGYGVQP